MPRHIYIYSGAGTSRASVRGWWAHLSHVHPRTHMHLVTSTTLLPSLRVRPPTHSAVLMPGGADLPYMRDLPRATRHELRALLAQGLAYIGVCAGAYFASAACVFEPRSARLRVVASRAGFFPRAAIGAARPGFAYGSEAGASVETLVCAAGVEEDAEADADGRARGFRAAVYCNGGPAWTGVRGGGDTRVLARYDAAVLARHGVRETRPVAALAHRVRRGVVVLCGVHPELGADGEAAAVGAGGRARLMARLLDAARVAGGGGGRV